MYQKVFSLNFTSLCTLYLTGYALIIGLFMKRFIILLIKKYIDHKWQGAQVTNMKKMLICISDGSQLFSCRE